MRLRRGYGVNLIKHGNLGLLRDISFEFHVFPTELAAFPSCGNRQARAVEAGRPRGSPLRSRGWLSLRWDTRDLLPGSKHLGNLPFLSSWRASFNSGAKNKILTWGLRMGVWFQSFLVLKVQAK